MVKFPIRDIKKDNSGKLNSNYKIALLIDCDNVSHQSIEGVLRELAKYGAVNVRHAHGNWNGPQLGGWIEKLHANAIRPVQQFAYTSGKNATDDGWAHLGRVGQYISNNSSFSPVNYGYKKLSDLIRASELFEISILDKSVLYIKSP